MLYSLTNGFKHTDEHYFMVFYLCAVSTATDKTITALTTAAATLMLLKYSY